MQIKDWTGYHIRHGSVLPFHSMESTARKKCKEEIHLGSALCLLDTCYSLGRAVSLGKGHITLLCSPVSSPVFILSPKNLYVINKMLMLDLTHLSYVLRKSQIKRVGTKQRLKIKTESVILTEWIYSLANKQPQLEVQNQSQIHAKHSPFLETSDAQFNLIHSAGKIQGHVGP